MVQLSPSEKDYMEAIYILAKRLGSVRSVDVANYLEHSKPSVTVAVQNLCSKGYLQKIDRDLVFTDSGQPIAENIFERHCILTHALKEIGIDEPTAIKDGQSMERVISDEAVEVTANAIQCQKWLTGVCPAGSDRIGMMVG
ncbi:MAG: metal-dependent transcriptional regulator [Lacrimispora sp.]|uniref:metal-dependent transcriptional regulator n=1 Tax=Lacrimispora sp. TaxID=2719234 RepID=UPI0039E62A40